MQPPPSKSSLKCPSRLAHDWPSRPDVRHHEPRNLLLLALHQIVLCVGWIFKTESVIMPAFIDRVAGPGWVRGLLPVLNRLGQSVLPILSADCVKAARYKKWPLVVFTLLMSFPFAALAAIWFALDGRKAPWLTTVFLALYFLFFVFDGLYLLAFGTVQGKLIRPTRRGLLLSIATFWGSPPAILFAWLLLRPWLRLPDGGFGYIFAFTAVCFFLSGLIVAGLAEPGDHAAPSHSPRCSNLRETIQTLRQDANLRWLLLVGMLFGSALIVVPHYQALARERLGLGGVHLMVWVIAHNAAVAVASLLVGPLADLRGNRLTLRLMILGSALAPALAGLLPKLPRPMAADLFWIVFLPLGVTPLVLRVFQNYALEICEPPQHPRYVSITNLGLLVPFLASPAVGWLIDAAGFEFVFLSTVGLLVLGSLLTFRLEEPRHRHEKSDRDLGEGKGSEPSL